MSRNVTVIGLTGSIGMGKSAVANMLETMNIPVFDSDAYVHQLSGKGGQAVPEIIAHFPQCWKARKKQIDREILRELVFTKDKDPQKQYEAKCNKQKLESILHPLVHQGQEEFIKRAQKLGQSVVALDIPLLFETGSDQRMDYTMVVSAPEDLQYQRVIKRPNMTNEKFFAILGAQMPDELKRRRADFVIPTGCNRSRTYQAVKRAINCVKGNKAWKPKMLSSGS